MINQTLTDDFRALALTNNEYARYRDRWNFLYQSYVGGEEYRQGFHLTKYQLETPSEYNARLAATPYDNHPASVISTYIGFLFREEPDRDFESWAGSQDLESFLEDCDYEGRSFNQFMKDVATWSSVFGHCWIMMTKPNIGATTLGQEMEAGVRPYVNLMTPLVVSDWRYQRKESGAYELTYLKYIEEVIDKITVVRKWYLDRIETWISDDESKTAYMEKVEPNQLGMIPAVLVYNKRSVVKGIGVSDISDIADTARMIYNLTSEADQGIRMAVHSTLVVPPNAQVGSGAGAMIVLQESSDPGLNPYLLEQGTSSIDNIYNTIEKLVESIDRMAHTGGVRGTQKFTESGISMEVEFSLLNSRLAEKADNLEVAEEQLWRIFGAYQGREWEGEVEYPDSFNIRDEHRELQQLATAKSAATDPVVLRIIDEHLVEMLDEDKARLPFIDPNPQTGRTYPDGEPIADSLPNAYQPASNPDVPEGQNCENCEYYKPGELYCAKFDAPVRAVWWCAKWEPAEEEEY
jgi:hypothetical protein